MLKKPNIFEYQDLSQYLREIYKFRKATEKDFSYEKWAEQMGFRSRAYLRALVIGEKPMHENLLSSLLQGLSLHTEEEEYLALLLRYSATTNPDLKARYGQQVVLRWQTKIQQQEVVDFAEFFANPLTPTLFTYLSFEDATANLESIAQALQASAKDIQAALKSLIWLKLIEGELDAQGRLRYKTVSPFFKIPSQEGNPHLKAFHLQGLQMAEKASALPTEMRKFYASYFAMDESQFRMLQGLLQDFQQKLLGVFSSSHLGEKKIYRLNMQVFPVLQESSETPIQSKGLAIQPKN